LGGELLAIVQAEREADSLLKEADDRRARALQEALVERKRRLRDVSVPDEPVSPPRTPRPQTVAIHNIASKNRTKAIARILEEVHAQA